jgi:GGDEF domain-containing protein
VISILAEVERENRLKRAEAARGMVTREYARLIRTVAENAVELDPVPADEFRRLLRPLQTKAESAESAAEFAEVHTAFREELRRYRGKCEELFHRIQSELSSAETAMESIAGSVAGSGAELEAKVTREITRLEEAADTGDIELIRETIHDSTAALAAAYEELQRASQVMIVQLQDEIRSLHQGLAEERRALYTDPTSGAWVRPKLDRQIEDLLRKGDTFWVLLARVEWKEPAVTQAEADTCLAALVRRLEESLGRDAMIGRWDHDVFAAVLALDADPEVQAGICAEIQRILGEPYFGADAQGAVFLSVKTAPVAHFKHAGPAEFYLMLGRAVSALSER